jgi:glutamate carboxypeptidase
MTEHEIAAIRSHLLDRQAAMIDLTARLAAAESPTDNPAAVGVVLGLLANELRACGLCVRRRPGRGSAGLLVARPARPDRRRPVQLLVGHCDTVWPVGTLARMPVRVDAERIAGPGVFDMKGGLVLMIFALRTLHELGLAPPADCVAVINSDEEVGSEDSTATIRRYARLACRAFVLEPAFGIDGRLKTARKASGTFEVVIRGRAAHAGVNPEAGVSAILELSHQIQRLFALNDADRGITVNVGTIDGGLRPNVVAPEVHASVDVRVRTTADADEVAAKIRGLRPINPQTSIEVTGGFSHLPMEPAPRNRRLWLTARRLGRSLGLDLQDAAVGGASDGNTTSRYTATLDGLGVVGDGAHALHEHALVAPLVDRCALLTLLLLSPLDPPEEPP